jgi:hypothetical protein
MIGTSKTNSIRLGGLTLLALAAALVASSPAMAGSYIVAQCSPGVYTGADDAGFSATTTHYKPYIDCSPSAPGLQIEHRLATGETGTVQGAYGAWVWTAPPGTYITGGSTYSRLATEDGQHGYLAVSPDTGGGLSYENQNDDQGHESGIPAGNWRFLVARLECTQPNENGRCAGAAGGAHAYVKQVRIQLTDVAVPTVSVSGSMLSGAVLHGPQSLEVTGHDEGAGLQSVQITINGSSAGGDDLSGDCHPLPGNMTSRLAPCPPDFAKTYSFDTAKAPFQEGENTVAVCVYDYAQTGTANNACQSYNVLVDNLCPGSSVGGGNTLSSGFGNGRSHRTLAFRRRALIRGRLHDASSNPIANAEVCIEGHTDLPGRPFHLIGTAPDQRKRRMVVQAAPRSIADDSHRLSLRCLPDLHRSQLAHAGPGNPASESAPHEAPPSHLLLRRDRRSRLGPTSRRGSGDRAWSQTPLPGPPRQDRCTRPLPRRLCLYPCPANYEIRLLDRGARTERLPIRPRPLSGPLHPSEALSNRAERSATSSTKEEVHERQVPFPLTGDDRRPDRSLRCPGGQRPRLQCRQLGGRFDLRSPPRQVPASLRQDR